MSNKPGTIHTATPIPEDTEAPVAPPIQPVMTATAHAGVAPTEPTYADDDRVTVTINYGANDLTSQRFWVGNMLFSKDRIARNQLYKDAKALQRQFGTGVVRIHPNDATEARIAQQCGVRPAAPDKVAAMLLASNLDALAAQLQPDELEYLAKALQAQAIRRGHETQS